MRVWASIEVILVIGLATGCVTQTPSPIWCIAPELSGAPTAHLTMQQGEPQRIRLPEGVTYDGQVVVELCADETGRLSQEPRIIDSSGIPAVDAAVVRVIRESQLVPARRQGQAVPGCCLARQLTARARQPGS